MLAIWIKTSSLLTGWSIIKLNSPFSSVETIFNWCSCPGNEIIKLFFISWLSLLITFPVIRDPRTSGSISVSEKSQWIFLYNSLKLVLFNNSGLFKLFFRLTETEKFPSILEVPSRVMIACSRVENEVLFSFKLKLGVFFSAVIFFGNGGWESFKVNPLFSDW